MHLTLNNLQWLMWHKTQPNQTSFYLKVSLLQNGRLILAMYSSVSRAWDTRLYLLQYDTKLNPVLRFLFSNAFECRLRFHFHYSQVNSARSTWVFEFAD